MSDVQMKRRWKERRKKIADEFFAGDEAVADAVLDALPYSTIPDWDDVAAIVRAIDAAGLLATTEHDRKVIEKFLREEYTPKIRIEDPDMLLALMAKAWDEGFKQGGPMHDVHLDDPDAHTRNPYRKGETDDRR